jgi:hypothetical protein
MYDAKWVACCTDPGLDAGDVRWGLRKDALEKRGVLRVAHPFTSIVGKDIDILEAACGAAGLAQRIPIGNLEWSDSIRERLKCDVQFDHLQGYFGVTSIEAAAVGMPSICYLSPARCKQILDRFGGDRVPWLLARDRFGLNAVFTTSMQRTDGLRDFGGYARRWYQDHFTNAIKAKQFVEWLEQS